MIRIEVLHQDEEGMAVSLDTNEGGGVLSGPTSWVSRQVAMQVQAWLRQGPDPTRFPDED